MCESDLHPHLDYFSLLVKDIPSPTSLSEFVDCRQIAKILSRIKQFPICKVQQNPTSFAQIFSNLKTTYRKIEEFWNKELGRELQCEEIDFVEMAHHKNQKQLTKVLNLVLQTLIASSQKQYFIGKILQTSPQTQQYFMSIVESTLQEGLNLSPRKKRQQRIYDKMIELEYQNENLQNYIMEVCRQKQQAEMGNKKYQEKLAEKEKQIMKLNEFLLGDTESKDKKKEKDEESESSKEFVEKLKKKLIQVSEKYQKQIYQLKQEVEELNQRAELSVQLENQLELYKLKVQQTMESMQQYSQLSKKCTEMKIKLIEKQQKITENTEKLTEKIKKIDELEYKLVQKQLQLLTKNRQIDELHKNNNSLKNMQSFDDNMVNTSLISLHTSLSEQCPEVLNTQVENLYENNKKLREELEKSTSTIKQLQDEVQKLKKLTQKTNIYEIQNKKLLGYIQLISNQHNQQKMLLLGTLYQFRMKSMDEPNQKQKNKKHQILNNLKNDASKILLTRRKCQL